MTRPATFLAAALALAACLALGQPSPASEPAPQDPSITPVTVPQLEEILGSGGRKLAVAVMAAWCGPCVDELPRLEVLNREFKDKGVELVGVSLDFAPEDLVPILKRTGASFPFYWVGEKGMAALSVRAVPLLILMDNGREAARIRGAKDLKYLRRRLDALAQGRPVKP